MEGKETTMKRLSNLFTLTGRGRTETHQPERMSQPTLNRTGLRRRLVSLVCAASAMLGLASLLPLPAAAQWTVGSVVWTPSAPKKHPDYNGDGLADLAIGAPGERIGGGQGAVHVAFGSS